MIEPELFREYFEYLNKIDMYENLNKAVGSEENKAQVNAIRDKFANLMEAVKRCPTSHAK